MKIKPIHNRKLKTTSLSIRLTKGEKFEYVQAEVLNQGGKQSFLRFVYEQKKSSPIFYYDTTGLVSVETYLEAKLSLNQFNSLLENIVTLVEECTKNNLDYQSVLYDHDRVFFDADAAELRFIYVPASGLKENRANILSFLREVAQTTSFICEDDQIHANNLLDFLQRQAVFSLLKFQEYLSMEKLPRREKLDSLQNTAQAYKTKIAQTSGSKKFNFMKSQTGNPSSLDIREQQSLAEKIASDVSDAPSKPITEPTNGVVNTPKSSATLLSSTVAPSLPLAASVVPLRFHLVRLSTMHRFELPEGKTSLGRSSKCNITLKGNNNISRNHAYIEVQNNTCFLVDQNSTNKCFVHDCAIAPETPIELPQETSFKLADEEFLIEHM